jgi:hypothetical protein
MPVAVGKIGKKEEHAQHKADEIHVVRTYRGCVLGPRILEIMIGSTSTNQN